MNELAKQIESNKELAAKVMEMWKHQASAEEIAKVISENGIQAEPSQAEDLLKEIQEKRKATIGARELDDEELERVAGGIDWCDHNAADCTVLSACDKYYFCLINYVS